MEDERVRSAFYLDQLGFGGWLFGALWACEVTVWAGEAIVWGEIASTAGLAEEVAVDLLESDGPVPGEAAGGGEGDEGGAALGVKVENHMVEAGGEAAAVGFEPGFFEDPEFEKASGTFGWREFLEGGLLEGVEEALGDEVVVEGTVDGLDVDADAVGEGGGQDDELAGVAQVEVKVLKGRRRIEKGGAVEVVGLKAKGGGGDRGVGIGGVGELGEGLADEATADEVGQTSGFVADAVKAIELGGAHEGLDAGFFGGDEGADRREVEVHGVGGRGWRWVDEGEALGGV